MSNHNSALNRAIPEMRKAVRQAFKYCHVAYILKQLAEEFEDHEFANIAKILADLGDAANSEIAFADKD